MTITPPDLNAMRARDRAFGDGESEDASDIAMDRHALLDRCEALQAALLDAAAFIAPPLGSALPFDDLIAASRKADALRALAAGGAHAPASAKDPDR